MYWIRCILVLLAGVVYSNVFGQTDSIYQRIFLIGDAGDLQGDSHPVIDWVKKNVVIDNDRNTVIYLGDNIYPLGLPMEGDPSYPESKRIIDYQIDLVKGTKAKAFFVPGNHDWMNGKIGGWQQVINEVNYINSKQLSNVQVFPQNGCPGPVTVELNEKVVVVFMDSQWFLHIHQKPGPGSNCNSKTVDEFITELKEVVASHPNQLLILAMHHPMYTYGSHGNAYTWKSHIFPFTDISPSLYIPLPVIGSAYPLARGFFGTLQDSRHPLYRSMVNEIEPILKQHKNAIAVAGHEHVLQMIMKDSIPYIVSGSGSKINRVNKGRFSLFADAQHGLSVIEIRKSGRVEAKFFTLDSKDLSTPIYSIQLKQIIADTTKPAVDTLLPQFGNIAVAADPSLKAGSVKKLFNGENYRKEWTTPVTVPILNVGTEMGGLTTIRQRGGTTSKTLWLQDNTGNQWSLRSIKEFPEAVIPPDLRRRSPGVFDAQSATYPFAALVVASFAKAANIPQPRLKLVYVPDDPRLNRFRKEFKNTLAYLEEAEPANIKKSYNSDELFIRLLKDNDDHVDQSQVFKARLLDNFIMDFDRYEDQWRWATRDTGKGKIYFPIPKNHDQALYTNQGIVPKYARKDWLVPEIQGFKPIAKNIKTFNRPAHHLDRLFLNELSLEDWKKHIDTFISQMTDEVIEKSLRSQPIEVQSFSTDKIIRKLKRRREHFKDEMLTYYRYIARDVDVVGTDQTELFTVTKKEDGRVHIQANKIDKSENVSSKIYDRTFDPNYTQNIQIYGLGGNDSFLVSGGATPIKIRIVGGSGNDHFANQSKNGFVWVYDVLFENNRFSGDSALFRRVISNNPRNNLYSRAIGYNYSYINPGISFEYNVDDGLFIGGDIEIVKRGFRKEPYGQRHYLRATRAFNTSSLHFKYSSEFVEALGNHDVFIDAEVRAPINVTNFFGLGNNSVFDRGIADDARAYYRTRYDIGNMAVLLRRRLQSWFQLSYGASFQFFDLNAQKNSGHFVSDLASGLNQTNLYEDRLFAGAEARIDVNSKNNQVLPSRGAVFKAVVRPLLGINQFSRNVVLVNADLSIFMSLKPQSPYVLATRFGFGHNLGNFEFQQAQYLGGKTNLRGYVQQRFGGRTMFYNNTELRVRLADFNVYLFPGAFGILAFHDVGRVWLNDQQSSKWHTGYGAGIWISPVKRFVLTASATRSKEESLLPRISMGFQF